MSEQLTATDVLTSGNLSRNYSADEIREAVQDAPSELAAKNITRQALRRLDSGRFVAILEDNHKWLSHMDFDGLDAATDLLSDEMVDWVNLYGWAQDLRHDFGERDL